MNINHFLFSLGTASVLGISAATIAFAVPESTPETTENITRIIPSNNNSLPPIVLIEQREANNEQAVAEKEKKNPIKITVGPNDRGVPIGIDFTEREEPEEAVAPTQRPIEYAGTARGLDPLQAVVNASAFLESVVRSHDGVPIGIVEDFIVDKNSGRIGLIAIGPGEKFRLVQPQSLEPAENPNELTLNIDASRWEGAPSVPSDQIDQIALQEKVREVQDYYRESNRPRTASTQERTTMRQRPSAPNHASATRSELSEQAYADAQEALSQRSSGPSLNQARLRQSSRSADRTPGQPFSSDEEPIQYGVADRETEIADTESNNFRAREILGEEVESEGESFAYVSDLIADLNVGYLQHVIITRDDNQAASYAVPLQQLTIGDGAAIQFLGDLSELDHAPQFDARMARLHRYEPFRYEVQDTEIQYGAPEREPAPTETEQHAPTQTEQPDAIDQE